ncbi:M48 family metallopeptidase [Actinoplanes derwentensis]|uniref:Zn-dependent protease with chaperone function n=1 Tax=Actinoplanes derwentensis TaxID=113562 RepID=A0A1H2CXW6_9ACTN|nr:M48 family metallopeptidase [Actinoplanes derwentensis]GID82825.1 Zn-dependent protease [Actinoplanes derwentensis]SDT75139.1 Zn-dependent protease with chaperone function [Actinoplanes derwentensis]
MSTALRAAVSVAMLVGFYVLGLLQLAVVGFLLYEIWTHLSGLGAAKLSWVLLVAVGAVVTGLWRAIRSRPSEPEGLLISPEQAPVLWQTVREMATEAGTRAPDEIRLVPEVNAAVSEDTTLLGLIGGTRRLYLGMPLLQTFTVDQLRSVLAHELGHYSGSHTRLSAVAYRGRAAMHETLSRVGKWNVFGWVFKGYGRLYLLVSNAVTRQQEFEADQVSVRVAGLDAAVSTMRELPVIDAAWDFYFGRYVAYGWEHGYAPDDIFGGFGQLYAARTEELARLRDQEPDTETSRWDTHPAIGERIAAMRALPAVQHAPDRRPAAALLPQLDGTGLALQAAVVNFGDREVLPWAEFTAASITAVQQRRADRIFRSAGRRLGVQEAGLAEIFDLVTTGKLGELAAEFFPNATRKEAAVAFADPMDDLITLAAVRSGVATFQHSWSAPARLVDAAGEPVDYAEIAKLAVDPQTVEEARERLAAIGVHVDAARVVESKATASGADVLGAMASLKVDDQDSDLILLNRGFVFVPAPKGSGEGEKRLKEMLSNNDPAVLAGLYRFVPYEEVTDAKILKAVPISFELTLHDGTSIAVKARWTGEELGDSRDTVEAVLKRISERAE